MAKESLISNEKACFICGTTRNINLHHIFFGTSNRKQSDKYGMWVYLCVEHHTGRNGVHFNKNLDLEIKQMAQKKFEETHTRDEFRAIFGKSWL